MSIFANDGVFDLVSLIQETKQDYAKKPENLNDENVINFYSAVFDIMLEKYNLNNIGFGEDISKLYNMFDLPNKPIDFTDAKQFSADEQGMQEGIRYLELLYEKIIKELEREIGKKTESIFANESVDDLVLLLQDTENAYAKKPTVLNSENAYAFYETVFNAILKKYGLTTNFGKDMSVLYNTFNFPNKLVDFTDAYQFDSNDQGVANGIIHLESLYRKIVEELKKEIKKRKQLKDEAKTTAKKLINLPRPLTREQRIEAILATNTLMNAIPGMREAQFRAFLRKRF